MRYREQLTNETDKGTYSGASGADGIDLLSGGADWRLTFEIQRRMGARVVEGTGLENRQGFTLFVGSNPTPSASSRYMPRNKHNGLCCRRYNELGTYDPSRRNGC